MITDNNNWCASVCAAIDCFSFLVVACGSVDLHRTWPSKLFTSHLIRTQSPNIAFAVAEAICRISLLAIDLPPPLPSFKGMPMLICIHIHTCLCMILHMIYAYIHTYIHAYRQAYMHTHTHIYTLIPRIIKSNLTVVTNFLGTSLYACTINH